MLKLPLLQPHLTGSNGIEGRTGSASKYSPFLSTSSRSGRDGDPTSALEVKGWEAQATDITTTVTSSEKYKSLALHAEVKLAEALERCARVCPSSTTASGEEKPNKLKTAVCCQLLGEFAELCGPLSTVMKAIKDELVKSIYSWYYVSERGMLIFDQLPWFSVADRLEKEKDFMAEEREKFQQMLLEQHATLAKIEEKLATYQKNMAAAQAEATAMRTKVQSLTGSEENARKEAKAGREELKALRKQMFKLKDDLDAEREDNKRNKELHEGEKSQLVNQIEVLNRSLQHARAKNEEADQQLEARLQESLQQYKKQIAELENHLQSEKSRVRELERMVEDQRKKMGNMTPRPNWKPLVKAGLQMETMGKKTQDVVFVAAGKLSSYLNELQAAKLELQALQQMLQADPAPREVQLNIVTDTSPYFITEGDGEDTARNDSKMHAQALGLGAEVPRCLRWQAGQIIELEQWAIQDLEVHIMDIWRAKHHHELTHAPEPLQGFLYHYYTGRSTEGHSKVVKASYSLYYACSCHCNSSAVVRLFRKVLTGQMSEEAHVDQQMMMSGLSRVACRLADAPGPSGRISAESLKQCTARMFPTRAAYQMRKLHDAIAQLAQDGSRVEVGKLLQLLQPLGCYTHEPEHRPPSTSEGARNVEGGGGGSAGGSISPASADGSAAAAVGTSPPTTTAAAAGDAADAGVSGKQEQMAALLAHPLVNELLSQHLDDLEAGVEEVHSRMLDAAGQDGLTIGQALSSLGDALQSREQATACVARVLGAVACSEQELGAAVGLDTRVEAVQFAGVLVAKCLVKPVKSYSITDAVQWAAEMAQQQQHDSTVGQLAEGTADLGGSGADPATGGEFVGEAGSTAAEQDATPAAGTGQEEEEGRLESQQVESQSIDEGAASTAVLPDMA